MKNIKRTVLIGICLGIVFFGWVMYAFYQQNWNFSLFSSKHWGFIADEFAGGWEIKSTSDWIFLVSLVCVLPVFIYLWRLCCRVQWRKSIGFVYHRIKSLFVNEKKTVVKKKIKVKTQKSHKKVRPRPMNTTGRPLPKLAGKTMDANMEAAAEPPPPPNATPTPAQRPAFLEEEEDIANIPLADIQLPERIALTEDLTALLSAANYQVIQDISFQDTNFNLVGISADTVLLCLTDTEQGDWLADEEFFNGEEPLWFSESAHRISPVYQLKKIADTFAQKLEANGFSQTVKPILIEKSGTIINAEEMSETWQRQGVIVCRTDLGGPEELPSFAEAIPTSDNRGSAIHFDAIRDLF